MPKNKALAHAIVDSDMTQRQIARKARIDETRLSRIISGQTPATPREQKALARVLAKAPSALFTVAA